MDMEDVDVIVPHQLLQLGLGEDEVQDVLNVLPTLEGAEIPELDVLGTDGLDVVFHEVEWEGKEHGMPPVDHMLGILESVGLYTPHGIRSQQLQDPYLITPPSD